MTKLLTIAEAAEAMNLSASTVRGLCSARKLRHERPGLGRGVIRIPEDAIDEYRKGVTVQVGQGRQQRSPAAKPITLRNLSLD